MDVRELGLSEEELLKKLRELEEIKRELHDLMKRIVLEFGVGSYSDDWCDDVEIELGGFSVFSCGYYGQLRGFVYDCEYEFDEDLDGAKKIFREVKKRYAEFGKRAMKVDRERMEIFGEVFGERFEVGKINSIRTNGK